MTVPSRLLILLAYGFRPFFFLASLWAVLAMFLWMLILQGVWQPEYSLPPSWWHSHEMLFGYIAAAAAGFLLTASPNWTKVPPLSGAPLGLMVLFWFAGRLAIGFSAFIPPWLVALLDLSFLIHLIWVSAPPLWHTGNPGHKVFPLLLGMMLIGNGLFHSEILGLSQHTAQQGIVLGIDAIIAFLIMVGGHIMPMFTRLSLQSSQRTTLAQKPPLRVQAPVWIERTAMFSMFPVLILDLIAPHSLAFGWLILLVGLLQGIRLLFWQGHRILHDPLVWVLHVGYAWLIFGLILRAAAMLFQILPFTTALHALTIGAMGLFTSGIMTRISLLHTGRLAIASPLSTLQFILIFLATIIRINPFLWDIHSAHLCCFYGNSALSSRNLDLTAFLVNIFLPINILSKKNIRHLSCIRVHRFQG
ncbi:MAG: NnrS family protein [Magnetococcus sp. DMHC-6]